ncbi:glycosyltransferase family 4 protein [Flexivirga caeni]|uniref:D-inositol 3-phosphate glycosyltransferase n=1 Tax=Flexivirga caeni TaxID=2294115 RepID=A0A3M9M9I9_9MICO|nr:glycosyltransferase family 4 protein [Flexivirga caeni]RNI22214.1 glycosyltransferase family 1 protein [Flexivirga caeni]
MKVALLSDCYPPRLGGIETQVHGLARALVAAGHAVEVFTITPGPADGPIPVHRLGLRRELPGGLLINPAARYSLRKTLQRSDFDVAHAQLGVVSPFAMDGVGVALDAGLPVAATWHSVTGHSEPLVRALGYAARWARRGAALSAVSAVAAAPLERVTGSPVAIVPNGIDTSFWSAGERPQRSGPVHVVSAMRLAARKRPAQLVDAVRRARETSGTDIRLTVAGDGPLWRRLRGRGGGWLTLPGRLSPEALRDLYCHADVYAAPAVLEAFGIAAAEARCAGLPVLTRAESAVRELVEDGATGLVVADDAGFAAAVARIATDPALRERLSAGSRQTPVGFGWPDVVQGVLSEYRRAASGG